MEHVETSSYVQNLLAGSIAASITSKGDSYFVLEEGRAKGERKGKTSHGPARKTSDSDSPDRHLPAGCPHLWSRWYPLILFL